MSYLRVVAINSSIGRKKILSCLPILSAVSKIKVIQSENILAEIEHFN